MNSFNIETTRRLAIGLIAASGALLFAALNLVGAGISGGDTAFAASVSNSIWPLGYSTASAFIALLFAEIADHEATPVTGHPHSKSNYLQTAFVLLAVNGLGWLIYGSARLLSAATIATPTAP